MDEHLAYVRRLSQLNGLEIDPPAASAYHVFAEGGFYMVHSYFGSNPGFRTTFAKAPAPQETPFDYTVDFGPSVTLGVADADGRGTRASWWRLEEHAEFPPIVGLSANSGMMISSVGVPGLPGFTAPGRVARQLKIFNGVIALDNRVHVEVWDWEVFQSFRRDAWFFLASAGVRYGYLSENYRAIRVNSGVARSGSTTFNLLEDSDIVAEGRNFAGVGPTAVLEVHRRVGATGLSLYGTVRGSVLFGHQGAQAFQRTVERLQTQVGSAVPRTSTTSSIFQGGQGADETIPMGDFEVGVNWSVDYGPVLLFLQAGLVDQTWFGAGSATSGGGNTGFYGLRLTAGFHY